MTDRRLLKALVRFPQKEGFGRWKISEVESMRKRQTKKLNVSRFLRGPMFVLYVCYCSYGGMLRKQE